jgi:hypothetical protein
VIRRTIVGMLTAGALVLTASPMAAASGQTVYQAILAQNRVVFHSKGYELLLKPSAFDKAANIRRYLPELRVLQGLLNRSATVVSMGSVTSSAQTQGRTDWAKGTREMASGIGALVAEGQAVLDGDVSQIKSELTVEKKDISAGLTLRDKGDQLLGLSVGD